jgi:DNA-binding beta-propeller fold protein YncE
MRRATRHIRRGVILLPFLWLCGLVRAQPADTVLALPPAVQTFKQAQALAVDPAGHLYVADAGRDIVLQLDAHGAVIATLGGPGAEEGAFDGPTDIDPTNGLILVVADAGNSRLQRFSRQFNFLESIPVGRVRDAAFDGRQRTSYRTGDSAVIDFADGRPIAVTTTSEQETFSIDEAQGVVLKWDKNRRVERVFGQVDDADGVLVEPVALAYDGEVLYVADRGLAGVVVFDRFGQYIRTLAEGRAVGVRAVTVHRGRLWVVLPGRLLVYEARGRLAYVYEVQTDEPLEDAALSADHLFLLTSTRLYRIGL